MNIRERNMTAAIWFLAAVASVAVIGCFALASSLGRCEKNKAMVEKAYEVLACITGGCR